MRVAAPHFATSITRAAGWPADGSPVVVDGNVEMPGRGLPPERFGAGVREIHTTYGGGLTGTCQAIAIETTT